MPRVGAGLHSTRERRGASIERGAAFGVEIGEYRGVVRVPRRVFQRLLAHPRAMRRCVLTSSSTGSRASPSESCRRQLTEDGNVEISGRD
jgi:hypothetical protein